jgi:anti-anti-sigma factor
MGSTMDLRIDYYRDGARHTLVLCGELDVRGGPALIGAVRALCFEGAVEILLDPAELDFVDSSGVEALLAAQLLCAEHLCDFSMTRGTPQLERLLRLTGAFDPMSSRAARHGSKGEPVELLPRTPQQLRDD